MELKSPGAFCSALIATLVFLSGCSGTPPDSDDAPIELPKSAVVFETREEACADLEGRIASGEVKTVDRQLSAAETQTVSDQLFAYEDVSFTAPTECGGSAAFVVGVDSQQAGVPEEVDGVPLLVYHQRPIELL